MSSLPNNTFASPGNPFYALVDTGGGGGGGSANSLQSPASVIPDGTGAISLVGQGTGNGDASLVIATAVGGTGDAAITVGANGVDYSFYVPGTSTPGLTQGNLYIGQTAQPQAIRVNGSTGVSLLLPTTVTDVLSVTSGANTSFTTDPTTNITTIGNPLTAGAVYLNNTTTVTNSGSRPPVGGIVLQQTAAANANISQQVASGAGSLTLGSSVTNPTSIFINDTGGGADTAVVDITKGTGTGVSLRLQGYGAGTAATVSTNLGTGGGGILNLTSGYNDPVLTPAIQIADTAITVNRQMTLKGSPAPLASWTAPGAAPGTSYIVLKAAGVSVGSFTVDLAPLQTGWSMVYGGVIPGATPVINDKAAFFAVMVYTDATNVILGGGVGGVAGLVTCQPADPGSTSLGINIAAATSANYVIYGMCMWGN